MSQNLSFEGPEKKLEIQFEGLDLLSKPRSYWDQIVNLAQAKILSEIKSDEAVAYLLSESSLFIWKSRLVLITCGKTELIKAAGKFYEDFKNQIVSIYFERKNEYYPRAQSSFALDDITNLKEIFGGEAYRFGRLDDHYVYIFNKSLKSIGVDMPEVKTLELLVYGIKGRFKSDFEARELDEDVPLNVPLDVPLSVPLDVPLGVSSQESQGNKSQENKSQGNKSQENKSQGNKSQENKSQGNKSQGNKSQGNKSQGNKSQGNKSQEKIKSEMKRIFSDYSLDQHFFDPYGFSLNGLNGSKYVTIHITPQGDESYFSFEMDQFDANKDSFIIQDLLNLCQPSSFDMIYFSKSDKKIPLDLSKYQIKQKARGVIQAGYNVTYSHYFDPEDVNGTPLKILGE